MVHWVRWCAPTRWEFFLTTFRMRSMASTWSNQQMNLSREVTSVPSKWVFIKPVCSTRSCTVCNTRLQVLSPRPSFLCNTKVKGLGTRLYLYHAIANFEPCRKESYSVAPLHTFFKQNKRVTQKRMERIQPCTYVNPVPLFNMLNEIVGVRTCIHFCLSLVQRGKSAESIPYM